MDSDEESDDEGEGAAPADLPWVLARPPTRCLHLSHQQTQPPTAPARVPASCAGRDIPSERAPARQARPTCVRLCLLSLTPGSTPPPPPPLASRARTAPSSLSASAASSTSALITTPRATSGPSASPPSGGRRWAAGGGSTAARCWTAARARCSGSRRSRRERALRPQPAARGPGMLRAAHALELPLPLTRIITPPHRSARRRTARPRARPRSRTPPLSPPSPPPPSLPTAPTSPKRRGRSTAPPCSASPAPACAASSSESPTPPAWSASEPGTRAPARRCRRPTLRSCAPPRPAPLRPSGFRWALSRSL